MEINVISSDENGQRQESTLKMPKLPKWGMADEIGYEPKTTFWDDFSIADLYGLEAIVDTFRRAFAEWRHDVVYLAELALVLNHKGCFYYSAAEQHDHDKTLETLSQLYFTMWSFVNDWAKTNLNEKDFAYYFKITD